MRILQLRLVNGLLIGSALFLGVASAFDTATYPPGTLRAAAAAQPQPDQVSVGLSAVVFKHRVVVTYVGPPQPLAEESKEVLGLWGKIQTQNLEFSRLFSSQIRVREGDTFYDLPIQDVLISPLQEELVVGELAVLYVMWIGNTRTRPVFLVNEFEK